MQAMQNIREEEVKKKFTELRQELGADKLKYSVDELVEIFNGLRQDGYIINGFLGSGAEGPVFSVTNNGNQIAVKVIPSKEASKIDNELRIMEKFKNQPYIHQYIRSFYSESKKYFFHLTEKLTCDLQQIMLIMEDRKQKFSYNQLVAFAIQMTTALSILESNQVIHSDLKPANILYDQTNKCFKISDYGFSKIIIQLHSQMKSATKGVNGYTLKYAAPEILQQSQDYTCKVDVFSLGLILLELVRGGELNMFEAMAIQTGAASISTYLNKQQQQQHDSSLNELISQMLIVDRSTRISASDLLQKLKLLQNNEESAIYRYLQARVDEITLQNMEQNLVQLQQLYSSSLTQVSLDYLKDTTKPIKWNAIANQSPKKVTANQQQLQAQQPACQLNNYFKNPINQQPQNNIAYHPQHQSQQVQHLSQNAQQNQKSQECVPVQQQQLPLNQLSTNYSSNNNKQQQQQQQQQYLPQVSFQQQPQQPVQQQLQQTFQHTQPTNQIQQLATQKYPQQQKDVFDQQQIVVQPLFKQHKQLNFKNYIETVQQLTEFEEALSKYRKEVTTSLEVRVIFQSFDELEDVDPSAVASRIASALEGCCQSITTLNLECGSLEIGSEGMKSISQSIGMMQQNLTTLNLRFDDLEVGSEGSKSLVAAIEKCSRNLLVVGLRFDYCKIDSDGIKYISQSFEKCEQMTTLGLCLSSTHWEKIGPTGAFYFASSLSKCSKNLTELTLALIYQRISNEGLLSIGQALGNCKKLTRLNIRISVHSVNEQSIEEFGSSLAKCPNLITLNVNLNVEVYYIAPSLPLFAKLTTLTLLLGENDQRNIKTLCTNLNQCSNLTSLCLKWYKWSLDKAISLVEGLEKSNLTALKLVFNECTFGGQEERRRKRRKEYDLGKSLSRFQKLTSLYIFFYSSKNNPTQFISNLLSEHLSKCQNLTTLSLGLFYSKLTPSDTKLVGASIEKCKYVQTLNLYLWKNEIKSEGALAISDSLQKCTNLKALELSIIEDRCCDDYKHTHVYTKYMDSVAPTITKDLKQCKNLQELTVDVKSREGEDDEWYIKLGVLTAFEADFWDWAQD